MESTQHPFRTQPTVMLACEGNSESSAATTSSVFIFYDEVMLSHQTGEHPERPERLREIQRALEQAGLWRQERILKPRRATADDLCLVHTREYVDWVRSCSESGQQHICHETVIMRHSYEAACAAAGAGLAAADLVMQKARTRAFCCVRPPGHHAAPSQAQGFCLFNNIAIAARHLLNRHGVQRLAIVDWDVHHGNGTQEIFYEDPRVFYLSLHRFPLYPGTGRTEEAGAGRGAGFTLNIPLPFNTSPAVYLERYERALHRIAQEFRPQVLLISAGFDAHKDDPIGGLGLQAEHYCEMTRMAIRLTASSSGGRALSMLEGGYNLHTIGQCAVQHVLGMMEA